jgi:ABC-2 type transport system permease protein
MREFGAAFRLQLRIIRNDPDYLMPLATVPLFTITFLAIVRHAGRGDLLEYALMAPVLIALWAMALLASGEVIAADRYEGTLEPAVAAPASFSAIVLGRIFAVTATSLVALSEVWLVARLLFDVTVTVEHPLAFLLTLAATTFAMAGTATIMASLFVLTRSARTFQNSLSYPFYVLGGVIVPVSFLPDWLEPLSGAVFLSWSADLLRDSLDAEAVSRLAVRLGAVTLLGAVGFVIGHLLLEQILRRARSTGEIGLA